MFELPPELWQHRVGCNRHLHAADVRRKPVEKPEEQPLADVPLRDAADAGLHPQVANVRIDAAKTLDDGLERRPNDLRSRAGGLHEGAAERTVALGARLITRRPAGPAVVSRTL